LQSRDADSKGEPVKFGDSSLPLPDKTRGGRLVFTIGIDFDDFKELRGDKKVLEANSVGLIALHEIEHGLHGHTRDIGPEPGDVERKYINPIRRELRLPERQFYVPREYISGGTKYEYLGYRKNQTTKILRWSKSHVEKVR
jgi:hypothetical protein